MNKHEVVRLEEEMSGHGGGISDSHHSLNHSRSGSKVKNGSKVLVRVPFLGHWVPSGVQVRSNNLNFVLLGIVDLHLDWLALGWALDQFSFNLEA